MADIKNFSLAGVGNNVQFGKRGAKLVQLNDAFSFRTADEAAFAAVQVATPTMANHAATKQYVDSVVQGLDPKQSVLVATTSNITLSGIQTIDGIEVVAGKRVLVKDQTIPAENGIYVSAEGAWVRAADANSADNVTAGLFTFVEKGASLSDTGWVLSTDDAITVGTTALTFTQFSSAGISTAGAGLSKTGNAFDVNVGDGLQISSDAVAVKLDGSTLAVGANGLKVADATIQRITTAETDIDNIQAAIAGLDTTKIYAGDGTQVETDQVAGKVTIDAAGERVATFQSGVASDSNMVVDTATAGKVVISSFSDTAASVDIHFQPQGPDGVVQIGEEGVSGMIQADEGMNLTLAGGDNANGAGGNLILRGGNGSTGEGSVSIETPAGQPMAAFSGPDTATNRFQFSTGTTQATVQIDGVDENIDLVLAPKNAGAVSVSGANVSNVANPVAAQDAATKSYVDTKISTDTEASKVGSLQTREIAVSTATTDIGSPIKGRIRRVMLKITQAYSAGTQITIGRDISPAEVVSSSDIDETTVGSYELNVDLNFIAASQLRVFVSGGPATGSAILVVEYVQG